MDKRLAAMGVKNTKFAGDIGNTASDEGYGAPKLASEMTLANIFAINAMHILGDGIFAKSPESVGFACANMYLKSR